MTVSSTGFYVTAAVVALNVAIPFGFPLHKADEIVVIPTFTGVPATLNVDYEVALTPDFQSASIIPKAGLVSKANGGEVKAYRDTSELQQLSLPTNTRLPEKAIERELDRAAMRDIEMAGGLARTLRVPLGEAGIVLPPQATRNGLIPIFSGTGVSLLPPTQLPGVFLRSQIIDATDFGRDWLALDDADDALLFLGAAPAVHNHDELYLNSAERFGVNSLRPDNDVPINTAYGDVNSRGGGVLMMPGSSDFFGIESPILPLSNVSMQGVSPQATRIRIPQTTTAGGGLTSHPITVDRKVGVAFRDFRLIGNRAAHLGAVPSTQFNGIYVIAATDCYIERVHVQDIENDGIVFAMAPGIGGTSHAAVRDCRVNRTKNGILCFKAGVDIRIENNWLDSQELVGILCDDATAADTTSATSAPCTGVTIANNLLTNYSRQGNAAGITVTGSIDVGVYGNTLRVGGVVGVDAPSSKSATGIVVNSGENRHNASIGVAVVGNKIDNVAGGPGITLQGALNCSVVGNAMKNMFAWPSALNGAAINLLQDTSGSSPQKGTSGNVVDGNAVEGSDNCPYHIQLGPDVTGNKIGVTAFAGGAASQVLVSGTAGAGQLATPGYGAMPVWTAGMRGWTFHSGTNDAVYCATAARWKPIGAPNESLPAWTAAQEGDIRYAANKLYVATSSAWTVVGTQT